MYILKVMDWGEEKNILINTEKELQQLINLNAQLPFKIIKIESFDYESATDYIRYLRKALKPDDLEYGKES